MSDVDRAAIERILKDDYDPKGDYRVGSEADKAKFEKEGYSQVGILKYLPVGDPQNLIFQRGGAKKSTLKEEKAEPPKSRPKARSKPKPRPKPRTKARPKVWKKQRTR